MIIVTDVHVTRVYIGASGVNFQPRFGLPGPQFPATTLYMYIHFMSLGTPTDLVFAVGPTPCIY